MGVWSALGLASKNDVNNMRSEIKELKEMLADNLKVEKEAIEKNKQLIDEVNNKFDVNMLNVTSYVAEEMRKHFIEHKNIREKLQGLEENISKEGIKTREELVVGKDIIDKNIKELTSNVKELGVKIEDVSKSTEQKIASILIEHKKISEKLFELESLIHNEGKTTKTEWEVQKQLIERNKAAIDNLEQAISNNNIEIKTEINKSSKEIKKENVMTQSLVKAVLVNDLVDTLNEKIK